MTELIHILYLDSDSSIGLFIKKELKEQGYIVDHVVDKADCLDKLSTRSYDVLVFEYLDPSDLDALKELADKFALPPSILVIDNHDGEVAEKAMKLGFSDYVVKHVGEYLDLLNVSIENVLAKFQLMRAREQIEKKLKTCREIEERVQSIAKVGCWEYCFGNKHAKWSPQEFRNFGYQPNAMTPTYDKYLDVIHPEDRELVKQHNDVCINKHQATEFVFRLLLDNNQIRYIHAITEVDEDENGEVYRIFGVSKDITEQKLAEARIKQAATVYENIAEAIYITDLNNVIVSINPAFTAITGYSEQQVLGQNPSMLSSGYHETHFFNDFWDEIKEKGSWHGEIWNRHEDGRIFPTWQSVTGIKDSQGNLIQYVSIFSDITRIKESEALVRYQANYDALTDLPNRTLFLDRIKIAIKLSKRSGMKVGLMLIDLDHFKLINDTMGHRAGDLVLMETARRIEQAVRTSDTVARLGGDEFTVILPELKHGSDAELIAKKILTTFEKPVEVDGSEVFISGSIGISIYPDDGKDVEALQKNSDSAMYSAKEAGRNRYHFFTPLLQAVAERRLKLITYLRLALERNEFSIVYQPIINITNNQIDSAEALIRWKQADLGCIDPSEFIPLAEETGLIKPIGDWVMRKVAEDMKAWHDSGLKPIQISLNISAKQFSSGALEEMWDEIFEEYEVSLARIILEVTESIFLEKGNHFIETLEKMQSKQMQISLDDFGSGYSSLSYLKRFPIDLLKIDKEFINDLTSDPGHALLVETIISLAEKMKIKVVAEGVETQQQLDFFKKNNCCYVQGYIFSKPLSRSEFEAYLSAH